MNDPFDLMTLFALENGLPEGWRNRLQEAHAARGWLGDLGATAWEDGRFQAETPRRLHALSIPDDVHGRCTGFVMRELERADSSLRRYASVQGDLVGFLLQNVASPEQQDAFGDAHEKGEIIGCCAYLEPDMGGDPARIRMRARPAPGGYVLDGVKVAVDCAPVADLAVVWALVDRVEGDTEGRLRAFFIPREREGFATPEVRHRLTLRGASMGEVVLNRCFVAEAEVLPDEYETTALAGCLVRSGCSTAWGVLGAALRCYESVLRHARRRTRAQGALITQERLMEMVNQIVQGHLMAHHLSTLLEEDQLTGLPVALTLRHNMTAALDIARTACAVMEAAGVEDAAVLRHAANLENVVAWETAHAPDLAALGHLLAGALEPA